MRASVLTGLFACTLVFLGSGQSASAETLELIQNNSSDVQVIALLQQVENTTLEVVIDQDDTQSNEPEEKKVRKHVVAEGETLTGIAEKYTTSWKRLFYKNAKIEDPNVIFKGLKLVIPEDNEKLKKREIPQPVVVERAVRTETNQRTTSASSTARNSAPVRRMQAGTSSGNRYVAGYCTWYVKNKRPSLPNNLGNAISWVANARAQGMATGSTPRAGAVGQRGNHVVYVERVNKDGTVTISEMNHKGLYVITTRTLPANYFTYIY